MDFLIASQGKTSGENKYFILQYIQVIKSKEELPKK